MTRIAFFELEPWESDYFRAHLPDARLDCFEGTLHEGAAQGVGEADVISVFINSRVDRAVLQRAPRLRLVTTRSTGYDHIDLAACAQRGIAVATVPTYGARTVAEYAFALMLALVKKIDRAAARVRQSSSFVLDGLRGFDLQHKTLGVVGTGHIGREVIGIARGFRMRVIASDIYPDAEMAAALGFRYVPLDELLAAADIISLHVPYGPKTHHLLNSANLAKVKRGAILINTARGGVVDTRALIDALHSGLLGGAALDVLEEEGAIREERELVLHGHPEERHLRSILHNHILIRMENVIVTPHNAFNTHEALEEILRVTVENIRGFLGGRPQNLVAAA